MGKNNGFILRVSIFLLLVLLPAILLTKGVYGSFIFTFSIPLIWNVVLCGKPVDSLGLRRSSLRQLFVGGLTGCLLGVAGGLTLKYFGIVGHSFGDSSSQRFALGRWSVSFALGNEFSYRLLGASSSVVGLYIYLSFSILVIGLGEELLWRGFIQQKIARYLPVNWAIFVTSILFALIHFYIFTILDLKAGFVVLCLIAIAGGAWGFLFSKYGSIWPLAVSHGVAAFILWKYFFFV